MHAELHGVDQLRASCIVGREQINPLTFFTKRKTKVDPLALAGVGDQHQILAGSQNDVGGEGEARRIVRSVAQRIATQIDRFLTVVV